ncbi:hypothetical protein DSO57_1029324 [Entomophthora muscae]|uniref:Uncharacterized protein n=1 Tax=Entomophthora muscae TaxID=34485 RepID=A0ACC2SDU7_9FUNG|nr:hypothetical protein DSO57_1029324 [Entomophthora muscae]
MVPLFILYASAYPCIIREMDECPFGISGVLGWQNTTVLLTKGLQIPAVAKYIALACTISAIVLTTIRIKLIPIQYHTSLPNLNAIGVGLILPQPSTPIAVATGGIISFVWSRIDPNSHKNYHLVMGAGAMAGAGISAALKAGLALAEVPSNLVKFGSIPN